MNGIRRILSFRFAGIATAALLMASAATQARAQAAESPAPTSSREILRSMSETLQAAKRISFHTELNFDEVLDDGQKIQFAGANTTKLRRPNGLSVDYRDDLSAKQLWYDGKTLTLFDPGHAVYAQATAPPKLEDAVGQFERDYGVYLPLSELLMGNPYENVLTRVSRGRYIGIHDVDGTPCHHLAFVGETLDWQLWVQTGETPVPRKVVVTYKQEPGSPQFMANMMDWDLDAKLSDSDFQAKVPEDAVATKFLAIEEVRR
jgi:hypothetical protein